jgi:hypothetical protein
MLETESKQTISADEINLKELILKSKRWLNYLKTKWVIILSVGLIGGIIGFGYAYIQKPLYVATLTFALEDEKAGGGSFGSLASLAGLDLGGSAGGAFSGSNLVALMKSRKIVEQTLLEPVIINNKKTSLVEYYLDATDMRKSWEGNADLQNFHFSLDSGRQKNTLTKDSIMGIIYETLISQNVSLSSKDKKTSIISIDVTSGNELFAKLFAENLAKKVSEFYIETKSKKAKLNLSILEKQTDSVRRELNDAISGVATENDNTYNLNPALNVKRVPSSKRQVDVQANTAILTQLVANLEMARVAVRKETPLIQVIDTPILPLKKIQKQKKNFFSGGFLGFIFLSSIVLLLSKKENT